MSDDIHPQLRPRASDLAADILKVGSGAIDLLFPFIGSKVVDFLVDRVLPTREERFARLLTEVSRKVRSVEERLEDITEWWSPAKQALFEDGARAAIRPVSDDRIAQIAHLVADGLTSDDQRAAENHRLLMLVEQLFDDDVIVLCAFTAIGTEREWREKHNNTLDMLHEVRGPMKSQEYEERVNYAQRSKQLMTLSKYREDRLIALGLLQRQEEINIRSGVRGDLYAKKRERNAQITSLGLLTLARLGCLSE